MGNNRLTALLLLTAVSAFAQFGAGPGQPPVPHLGLAGLSSLQADAQPQTAPAISVIENAANWHNVTQYGVVPGEQVAIFGAGFVAGTIVYLNGTPLAITYSSTTQINAVIMTTLTVGGSQIAIVVKAGTAYSNTVYANVTASDPGLYGCGSAPWVENQAFQIVGTCGYPALHDDYGVGVILWGNAFGVAPSGSCTASLILKQGANSYGMAFYYCGMVPGSSTEWQANFAFMNNNPPMPPGAYTATVAIDGLTLPPFTINTVN